MMKKEGWCNGPLTLEVAIIGMSGWFPCARNVREFWHNLGKGLMAPAANGIAQTQPSNHATERAEDYDQQEIDFLDGSLFVASQAKAEPTDPERRELLKCTWQALEDAGYDPERYERSIRIYLASSCGLEEANLSRVDLVPACRSAGTASGSGRAIFLACRGLLEGECKIALAGGANLNLSSPVSTTQQDEMQSPRAFTQTAIDSARVAVAPVAAAIVVLKRLGDALADGDQIHAVIRGAATSFNGLSDPIVSSRVSVQTETILHALKAAGIEADSVSYVEAHKVSTTVGPSLEVAALSAAYERAGRCFVGSAGTNVGDLGRASGVTGLIKTAFSLAHEFIPPTPGIQDSNRDVGFTDSPFYTCKEPIPWKSEGVVRRAGVNVVDPDGWNAHLIVEEAPNQEKTSSSRSWQLLLLSAAANDALDAATVNLAAYLRQIPPDRLADVAYTLQVGRKRWSRRRAIVCQDPRQAADWIDQGNKSQLISRSDEAKARRVIFMFPGVGDHYPGMTAELFAQEPGFRIEVDRCCDVLKRKFGFDLRDKVFRCEGFSTSAKGATGGVDLRRMLGRDPSCGGSDTKLNDTSVIQPALFVIDYALARLLMKWGIQPSAVVGYSVGEYVAACLAEVLDLEDALTIVAERARMIAQMPRGAMLAIPLAEAAVLPLLSEGLSLAAVNGLAMSVVAGTVEAVESLEKRLAQREVSCKRVEATHAFHSSMLKPVCPRLIELVRGFRLKMPRIPYLSNLTGTWITTEATDPHYWARHMCETVRFRENIEVLLQLKEAFLLEVGPGQTVSSLVKVHPHCDAAKLPLVLATVRTQYNRRSDVEYLLSAVARLWLSGVDIDWNGFHAHQRRRRMPLPTYPFRGEELLASQR